MSAENTFSELPARESGGLLDIGTMNTPCPVYGCKRLYPDRMALDAHVTDHGSPAQSLPGKVLLCSTLGCSGSFPNMKKLMEHMRHHHKPNIFFLCESCRTKLRSYRGLLTHLHTCSKVPRVKPKVTDTAPPLVNTGFSLHLTSLATNHNPPQLDSMSKSQDMTFQTPSSDSSLPQSNSAAAPPLAPTVISSHDVHPKQQELKKIAPDLPPYVGSAAAMELSDSQGQPQGQPQGQHRYLASAPKSPSGPSAIWKKNQGVVYSKRILWEHTKGRYVCVQCGHAVSNRTQVTQHICSHHRAAEDPGSSASTT